MAKVLMIIAPQNFRDEELFHTQEELENAGHETIIASRTKGSCKGMLSGKADAELSIKEVDTDDYDAVVFVGGSGAKTYFNDKTAHKIASKMNDNKKLVCAICIAPSILANAGVLKDRKATSWPSEKNNIKEYTGEDVTVDENIITANGPESARKFGKKIMSLL